MIRECHEITSILVHKMLDRSRAFHVERSAGREDDLARQALRRSRPRAEQSGRGDRAQRGAARGSGSTKPSRRRARWARRRLTDAQLAAIDAVRGALSCRCVCPACCRRFSRPNAKTPSPTGSTRITVSTRPSPDRSPRPRSRSRRSTEFAQAVEWPAARCRRSAGAAAVSSVRGLASEIQEAATRISGLVAAIKGFTHMDQATVAEPVDLQSSLGNTVAVLNVEGAGEIGRDHRHRANRTCRRSAASPAS